MSNEIVIFSFARHSVRQLLKNELKIMPYFTRLIKEMDRVGVEPTTSASLTTFYQRAAIKREPCSEDRILHISF
jgi:hypothetical protein